MFSAAKEQNRLHIHSRFPSRFLSTRRDLIVYLPPGYDESPHARYPVLYLQDGQNLFDPETAFGGRPWRADSTADDLIRGGAVEPLIIVGVYNTGVRRMSEYTPTRCPRRRKGGKADRYAELLAREIKPFIDHEYRTRKGPSHTGVGGSSLGGLAALVAVLQYPRVFGKAAVMSPSVWWDSRSILRLVAAYRARVRPCIWLDTGTEEGDNPNQIVDDARALGMSLLSKGWQEGVNLQYREYEGAGHDEGAWAARFGDVLSALFPATSATDQTNAWDPSSSMART